jgi:hypothetical protein
MAVRLRRGSVHAKIETSFTTITVGDSGQWAFITGQRRRDHPGGMEMLNC